MKKLPISICIIAYNEEKNIGDCLKSVINQAGQVVVLDAGSTDQTSEQVSQFPGVDLVTSENNSNLNVNKMKSFASATQDWIFYLDADERLTPQLWEEMEQAVQNEVYNGYRVGRKNIYFGKWLRYGGQYPELQPRLFRRGKGKFAMKHVHEFLEINGQVGDLKEPFIHLSYPTVEQYFKKFAFYNSFQAEKWAEEGVRWSLKNHLKYGFIRPFARFVQKYFLKLGFLDGFVGFVVCFMQGVGELAAYLKVKDYE